MSTEIDPKKLEAIDNEERTAYENNDALYDKLGKELDATVGAQKEYIEQWKNTQDATIKAQTDFTVDTIEQQRAQAKKDYEKEQSAAYVDWQKESNAYGVNAEKMAQSGMTGTGYSESSQVSMYNTYQNRVASALASMQNANLNYDNAVKEAYLQQSSALAEIALEGLQMQLELSLQAFQHKNDLLIQKSNTEREIESLYHNKWMDVYNAITEQEQFDRLYPSEEELEIEKPEDKENPTLGEKLADFLSNLGKKTDSTETANDNGKTEIKNKSILNSATITYDQALNFLNSNNLTAGGHRLENKFEWEKNKKSKKLGEWYNYPSYEAYLRGFLTWRLEER